MPRPDPSSGEPTPPDASQDLETASETVENTAADGGSDTIPEEGRPDRPNPRGQTGPTGGQSRRLRQDATSDPLRQQTEPDTGTQQSAPTSQQQAGRPDRPDAPQSQTQTQPQPQPQPQQTQPQQTATESAGTRVENTSDADVVESGRPSRPTQPVSQPPRDADPVSNQPRTRVTNQADADQTQPSRPARPDRTTGGGPMAEPTEEVIRQRTPRANQSRSLSVTGGAGMQGTREERARAQTPRANQSRSLGTTGTPTLANTGGEMDTQAEQEAKERIAEEVSEERGQDYSADDVTLDREPDGTVNVQIEDKETFDVDWSFGFGGPEDEVEQAVDSTADNIQQDINQFSDDLFERQNGQQNSAGAIALRAAGRDELAEDYDRGVRDFGSSVYSGAGALANVPGLVSTGMEAAEAVAAGANEAVTPGNQEVLSRGGKRGKALAEQAYEYAQEDTVSFAGTAAGSLVGSYGVMRGASRISSRAGTATRYAIQPGEELAGTVGFRATRRIAGEGTAQKAFPNKEPLIFSEEAAIRAGKKGAGVARDAARGDLEVRSRVRQEAKGARFKAQELVSSEAPTRLSNPASGLTGRLRQEARAARFRAAELASDEAPTRPTGVRERLPDASDATSRVRQEATAARFTLAEQRARVEMGARRSASAAREQASDAADAVTTRVRRFTGDERGQAQMGFQSRARGSQVDADTTPQIDTDDVTGRSVRPRGDGDLDSGAESRLRQASTRRVETNTDVSLDDSVGELSEVNTDAGAFERRRSATRPEVEVEVGGRLDNELAQELETRQETARETETRLDTELGQDYRQDFRSDTDTRLDLETETRNELEVETEVELEQNPRREVEFGDERRERRDDVTPFGSRRAESALLERDLLNPFTGR